MKKNLPILLLVLSLILVAIGIYGVVKSRNDKEPSRMHTTLGGYSDTDHHPMDVKKSADDYLYVSMPEKTPGYIKDYTGFRVSFNQDNHTPNWVAWELLGSETEGGVARNNKFWQDTEVPGCPTTRDYSNSGYDRGHLCPSADQKWSDQSMIDCFSLSNIAPQDHNLNTGAWKTLENKERQWAKRDSAIIIIAGPIYTPNDKKTIGQANVRVPSAFFKILAAPYLKNPRGIAFVYPNMTAPGNMQQYAMSIRELEKLTGFNFFSRLPEKEQDILEMTASFNDWNKR